MKPSRCPSSFLLFYFLSFYFPHFIHRFLLLSLLHRFFLLSLLLCPKMTLLQEKEALSKALEALRKQVADRTIVEDQVKRRRFLVRPSFNSLISTLSSHQYLFDLTMPSFIPSLTNTIALLLFSSHLIVHLSLPSCSISSFLFISISAYFSMLISFLTSQTHSLFFPLNYSPSLSLRLLFFLSHSQSCSPSHSLSLSLTLSLSLSLSLSLTHTLIMDISLQRLRALEDDLRTARVRSDEKTQEASNTRELYVREQGVSSGLCVLYSLLLTSTHLVLFTYIMCFLASSFFFIFSNC